MGSEQEMIIRRVSDGRYFSLGVGSTLASALEPCDCGGVKTFLRMFQLRRAVKAVEYTPDRKSIIRTEVAEDLVMPISLEDLENPSLYQKIGMAGTEGVPEIKPFVWY